MALSADELLASSLPRLRAAGHLYVAYSGGLDSTVLLHALTTALPEADMTAIHINHGLSPSSDQWQSRCQAFCAELGVSFIAESVTLPTSGGGVEQAARTARYRIFERLLGPSDLLLLAHHLDDQVETLMYRVLRGSGVRGLSAIPGHRALGAGHLLRPLLAVARSELADYASSRQLTWVEDESNFSVDFDRNFLRREVLPVIARRWPDYRQRISRTRQQCAAADQQLRELAQDELELLDEQSERIGFSLDREGLMRLSASRRGNLLREWVRLRALGPIGHSVTDAVERDLFPAKADGQPRVAWATGEFCRHRNRVYLLPAMESFDASTIVRVQEVPCTQALPDGSRITFTPGIGDGGIRICPGDRVELRYRQGGERCRPLGRAGSAPLKKILQERGVEPWLRDRVALVYINEVLAAVGDLFVCDGFECGDGEAGYRVHWDCA